MYSGLQMTQNTNSMDQLQDRRGVPVFIHSELDDMGLTPNAFRVYCHLARRAGTGVAWPSYQSIGSVCFGTSTPSADYARRLAIEAVKELVTSGLVAKEIRTQDNDGQTTGNKTNVYYLTPQSQWVGGGVKYHTGGVSNNTLPGVSNNTPKGTPSEGTSSKDVVVVDGRTLADVFRTWSSITKGTFNSIDSDKVKDLIDTHGAEAVYQAMLDANEQGKRTLAYVNGILRNRQNGTEKPQRAQRVNGVWQLSKVERSLDAVREYYAMKGEDDGED